MGDCECRSGVLNGSIKLIGLELTFGLKVASEYTCVWDI